MYPITLDLDNDELLIPKETIQAISSSGDFIVFLSNQYGKLKISPGVIKSPNVSNRVGRKNRPFSFRKNWDKNRKCYCITQFRRFFNHIIDSPINEMKGHYELHAKLENGELLYELPQFLEIVDLTDFDLVSPDVFK